MSNLIMFEKSLWEKGIDLIAGVDEAGRGPLAGPIVIASVILNKNDLSLLGKETLVQNEKLKGKRSPFGTSRNNDPSSDEHLRTYNLINDSKKLTKKRRELLYDFIVSKAICYSIVEISVEDIDLKGIGWANSEGFSRAIETLQINPEFVLSDHFSIMRLSREKQENIQKGDTLSISIAAASILAKVYRDRIMQEEAKKFPEYGFEKHKGYGTKAHIEAICRNGICKIHRKSFEPIKSMSGKMKS
ncbi:MAG TPA: ribonuclease HII [bacterium]|nr:ribonuclease HII [bacterium]